MSQPSRNAACPCGSGEKYKRCCGRTARAARGEQAPNRAGEYLRLHVSLAGAAPPVWRRFLLHADASFLELHGAIQALGWTDSHLWHFVDPTTRRVLAGVSQGGWFGEPDPDARSVRVDAVLREVGDRCAYVYDFGDSWVHEVVLEGVEAREGRFDRALLGGAGAFPPEDCGGIGGFGRLREFFETGEDPWGETEELSEWTEGMSLDEPDMARERERFGAVVDDATDSLPALQEPAPPPASRLRVIDGPAVETIVREMKLLLAGLADRLGVEIDLRRATYTEINARLELDVSTVRDDGLVMDRYAEEFLRRCGEFGLEQDDLGREFDCDGHSYRIIGLRPRANLPVICELVRHHESDGAVRRARAAPKRMRMRAAAVRGYLESRANEGTGLRRVPRV